MSQKPRSAPVPAILDEIDLIAEMSQGFAASQDIEETLRLGLAHITRSMGAEAASLFLLDEAGDAGSADIVCRACFGPVDVTGLRIPWGKGIVGRTIAENASRLVRDVKGDPDYFGQGIEKKTGFSASTILCAPMSVRGRCLGAIEIINKSDGGAFNQRDARLLQALASSAGLALFNARLMAAALEQEGIRRELALAAEIQQAMLPRGLPSDTPLAGAAIPARRVSGDFFDIVALENGAHAFCIGDVSGKGMDAALMMAKTASLFRCLAKTVPSLPALMATINQELVQTGAKGMFVTMIAGRLEADGRTVQLVNAGHEPALLWREGAFTAFPADAPPLGVVSALPAEDYGIRHLDLTGGTLHLFTDGLTEARGAKQAMLGADGVRALLIEHRNLPLARRPAAILEAVAAYSGGHLRDDLTLLLVEERAA